MLISKQNNTNREPDEKLLEDFRQSGDLEILGVLYQRYMHLVYGVCLRYYKNREEARDGVMQIFEKLVIEIPGHNIQKFKSWLYVLTKNYCLMEIRAGKSRVRKMDQWIIEQEYSVEFQPELHPVDEETASQNKKLRECIDRLKNEQKRCIQLFFFENKSYKEIVDLMSLDEKKVKSHLQNGKRNLKICLEEGYVRK